MSKTVQDLIPSRHRHPLRFRRLTVARVEVLSEQMRRIVLTGPELEGFISLGFDDHIKLFPPVEGQVQVWPEVTSEGVVWPEPKPIMRDYTPRAYDAVAGSLTVDFAVGHGGPATEWAHRAVVGDELGIAGPRGSMVVPTQFPQHLLIGDEAALPAIARRLEELPAGVQAAAVIEAEDEAGELNLTSQAGLDLHWVHRRGGPRGEARALTQKAQAVAGAWTRNRPMSGPRVNLRSRVP